jgi:periplasmic protein TonB
MQDKHVWLRKLPLLLGMLAMLLVVLGVYWLSSQWHKAPQTKKQVQQITMLQPPPPPPPEPAPPEPEVEEQKIEETVAEPEQEPEPAPEPEADQPAAETLGLDAEGGAGSDGFGLEGRNGGRSLLAGTGGSAVLWYGGHIKRQVEDGLRNLLADTPAMRTDYSVTIEVWVGEDGHISRCELAADSGKAEVDQAIRNALTRLRSAAGKPPPEKMPQPIRLRLSSRV